VAVDDVEGLPEADGLAEDGVVFGVLVLLGLACGLLLAQLLAVPGLPDGLALAAAFGDAVAVADTVAVADAVAVEVLLALALAVPLELLVALLLPAAGLVGELGAVGAGVTDGLADGLGLDEVVFGLAAGDADVEHDAGDDGVWCLAAVVCAPAPPPLPSARPPPAAPAAPGELADRWPSSTPDTDEVTTWRSGGTEAITTPTTNTAQATAMAGLSSAIRQSPARCCARRA